MLSRAGVKSRSCEVTVKGSPLQTRKEGPIRETGHADTSVLDSCLPGWEKRHECCSRHPVFSYGRRGSLEELSQYAGVRLDRVSRKELTNGVVVDKEL